MACGACNKNNNKQATGDERFNLMHEYQYLTQQQLQARLETFKRRYCSDCSTRYDCTYSVYAACIKRLEK